MNINHFNAIMKLIHEESDGSATHFNFLLSNGEWFYSCVYRHHHSPVSDHIISLQRDHWPTFYLRLEEIVAISWTPQS